MVWHNLIGPIELFYDNIKNDLELIRNEAEKQYVDYIIKYEELLTCKKEIGSNIREMYEILKKYQSDCCQF